MREVRGEPSDINWENLNLSCAEATVRNLIATLIVTIFLAGSIVGTFAAQTQQVALANAMSSCKGIETTYGENNPNGPSLINLDKSVGLILENKEERDCWCTAFVTNNMSTLAPEEFAELVSPESPCFVA